MQYEKIKINIFVPIIRSAQHKEQEAWRHLAIYQYYINSSSKTSSPHGVLGFWGFGVLVEMAVESEHM